MNVLIKDIMNEEKDITILVEGEIDVYTAPQLREKLLPYCQNGRTIVIDLSKVDYIDSTGIGVLIGAYKAQRATYGKLILTGMNARLLRIFKITGLHEIIEIEERTQEDGQS
ncbi:STAS domain-containing protein [Paenactinomyces guangxiensis]|uniref:Anti-sigma factor antagonist n=1 Tax=Paenactinomyces guangxiensis TaxID=1490290 RepID=A0A7W2A8W7_9BACL|nr:STAS domain-containing protein [Paenactinomyces guangxiensis]MBA4496006.1 STAS domain-containing protein [Paenactinomyces guangxiensis]MBH8593118.1 STAS domain-containing protein [Paenactinomyces guangxiensis]